MTASEHNRLAGIFLLAHGGIQTLVMLLLSVIYGIIGAAAFFGGRGEEKMMGVFFLVVVAFVVIFSLLFIIPQIIGGWKMYKEKPNARTWGIIGSIVACMSFPLGTAAGVFGLIFLFGEKGNQFYLNGTANSNYLPNSNYATNPNYASNVEDFTGKKRDYVASPPPPNSWQ